jgi:hypothetical protein
MVKISLEDGKHFYMDGFLSNNLSFARDKIKDNWDFLYVVDGGERKGKSVFAQQCAKFVDKSFNLDRVVFTPRQFQHAVLTSSPYTAIVYDEAYGGINSRSTMSQVNKSIVKMLTEIGCRNLFIFIVLPSFFELDRYVALWRSKALFHIYTDDNLNRGFFTAYNEESKKKLYIEGKKHYNYNCIKANFYGRFTNKWILNEKEYDLKKRNSTNPMEDIEVNDYLFRKNLFIFIHNNNNLKTIEEKCKALNIIPRTFSRYREKFADELGCNLKEIKVLKTKEEEEDTKEEQED